MKTCEHKVGRYRRVGMYDSPPVRPVCGKRAGWVAKYPNQGDAFYCGKHAKSREYISRLDSDSPPNAKTEGPAA